MSAGGIYSAPDPKNRSLRRKAPRFYEARARGVPF